MLAVTLDLALVIAALTTTLGLWVNRKRIQPPSVWEKLMAGCGLLTFALVARMSDVFWARLPWPALSDPLLAQTLVVIGLAGGAMAVVAGVVEWVPMLLEQLAFSRWRASWSAVQTSLQRAIRQVDSAPPVVAGLVEAFENLCDTKDVQYCARAQKGGQFVAHRTSGRAFTADEQTALQKLASHPASLLMRTASGWLLAIPVKFDRRLYGALLIRRGHRHLSFSEVTLLEQTASLAAHALSEVIRRVRDIRQAQWLATEMALDDRLGATSDPASDLMGMLDVLHHKLGVDYASVLAYEGDGEYARRYSRLWNPRGLSERGIQVATGHTRTLRVSDSGQAAFHSASGTLSLSALPHRDMAHHASVVFTRGNQATGLLVVASRRTLGHTVRHQLQRSAHTFAAAVERIQLRHELNQMSRRLSGLGRLAGFGTVNWAGYDYLTARMLDEIPGTFCQYMRLSGNELWVEYRRARRGDFGGDSTGKRFRLESLPTCRMVVEAGRSVVFRQDDPERCFEAGEARLLFGAEPNSILLVPVTQEGRCVALLAVGEMREARRHTFSVADRRYADSFSRLVSACRRTNQHTDHLGALGDLNLSFASPLTGILGSVEILRQKIEGSGPHLKYLDVIEKNASRIRAKVGELALLGATDGLAG